MTISISKVSIVIGLIIPFLISGPFFPDLILSISSLIFLFYVIKSNKYYFFLNIPIVLFLTFCFYCILVSIFVSDDILLSFESSLFYFRFGVFACLIWFLIEKQKNILNYFYFFLIISFSVLVLDGYFQYFTGSNVVGLPKYGARVSSFFGDELIMGSYLSRLFPLLFALFLIKKKNKSELYFIGLLFILIDVLIFISGERTAFFYLNLSTIFIIILIKKYQKFRLITFLIAFIIIGFLVSNNNSVKSRMISEPLKSMGFIEESKKKKIFSLHHDILITTAYKMFKDNPVFGHGPKMFRVKCNHPKYVSDYSCSTHPHNFYIQLLAETGLIGALFLFSILIYIVYCSIRQIKSILFKQKRFLTDYQVCLLAGILITVWPLAPTGNFFNNWLAICYTLPVGFYIHSVYGKNKKELI